MYSILLVDDESMVRQLIRSKIPWEECGFTVTGEAENGLEALDIAAELSPDVVITDIKMPYMDGIDFIRGLKNARPATTVIILSGYDEFTYAQSAIELGVLHYALKPICKEDFIELLAKIKRQLDEKIKTLTNKQKLEELYAHAIPDLQEQLLNDIYSGNAIGNIKKALSYNIPCNEDFYMSAVIDTDSHDKRLTPFAIKQVIDTCLEKTENFFVSVYKKQNVITFYYTVKKDESLEERLFIKRSLQRLQELQQYISFYTKMDCCIGIGKPVYAFSKLHISWQQSINALNYKIYYGDQNILYIGDLENDKVLEVSYQNSDFQLENLISSVKTGTDSDVAEAVDALFSKEAGLNPLEMQSYIFKIISTLATLSSVSGLNNIRTEDNSFSLFTSMSELNTIPKARISVKNLALSIHKEVIKKYAQSNIQFVEDAKKLIEKNYNDASYSLDTICDTLGVSNAYFSSTFKKETGIAFVKALNTTRINHAKTLLKTTDLKTYEIAETVGFSDSNYFSFCFKKLTGMSPKVFKRKE